MVSETIERADIRYQRGTLTVSMSGRLGGLETLRRHGREHFVNAGRLGQAQFSKRYTSEDRRKFGSMGGRPKKQRYTGERRQSK